MTMPRPQEANRPKEVDTSFWLWISTFVLGALGILVWYPRLQAIRAEAIRNALAENPALGRSALEDVTAASLRGGLTFLLLVLVVQIVFVFPMRGGRNWARIVLAVLGGLGLVSASADLVFYLSSGAGLSSVIGLFRLLLLAGAIVMMFRPAANAWFRPRASQL